MLISLNIYLVSYFFSKADISNRNLNLNLTVIFLNNKYSRNRTQLHLCSLSQIFTAIVCVRTI